MNNLNKSNLHLSFYQFGPLIGRYSIPDYITKELHNRGTKNKVDISPNLAGHIKNEKGYSNKDREWFLDQTQNIFLNYVNELQKRISIPSVYKHINLRDLWINFMKDGEYNPPHNHGGEISFVVYTSVPKEIISENRDFKGRGCGPGGIQFLYGETSKHYSSELAFTPETGTMFVFPATLRHYVAPFKSKVIRTSVSGNLYGQL